MQDDDDRHEQTRDLPMESSRREVGELKPHQKTIERFATAYYEGCRKVAGVITAIKRRIGKDE